MGWAVASNDSVNFGSLNSTEWVGGWLDNLSISANVRDVWGVNANGDVYHRSGAEGFWVQDIAPVLRRIAVSGDGRSIWGVGVNSTIYSRRWGEWFRVPGRLSE